MIQTLLRRRGAGALGGLLLLAGLAGSAVPVLAVDAQYTSQIRNARRFLARGQAEPAAQLFKNLVDRHPGDPQAAVGYVDALIALEKTEEAEAFLVQALEAVSEPAELYRARVRLRRAEDRPADAFDDVIRVMEIDANLEPWAVRETQELLAAGLDARDAERRVDRARKESPESVPYAVLGSVVRALRGEPEDALRRSIQDDKKLKSGGQTVLRYAQHMLSLGFEAVALDGMIEAADRTESTARRSEILFQVAGIQERQGRYESSLASLDQISAERAGTSAAGRALLASANIYQNYLDDPQGALGVYERLRDDPILGHHRPDMLLQMADCYVRLGRLREASETFRIVPGEAFDPEQAELAAFMEAEVAFYQGEFDSALTLFQDMAETYPRSLYADDAAARYIILNKYQALGGGAAVQILGRMEWARAVGRAATVDSTASVLIAAYPGGELAAEALLALADLSEDAEELTSALGHLETVVARHSGDRRASLALKRSGDLLQKLGRNQEALLRYERILTDYPASVLAGEARRLVEKLRRDLKS